MEIHSLKSPRLPIASVSPGGAWGRPAEGIKFSARSKNLTLAEEDMPLISPLLSVVGAAMVADDDERARPVRKRDELVESLMMIR